MDCNDATWLIAEDDDGHAELIADYLRDAGISNPVVRFRDGQEIWNFLSRNGPGPVREGREEFVVLLDIKMPRMDGVEVLRRIKGDPELMTVPVIMLTTTDDPREIDMCYRLGCSFYVSKPVDSERFSETMRHLGLFVKSTRLVRLK